MTYLLLGEKKMFVEKKTDMPIVISECNIHRPIVIAVDKSEAMDGPPIDAINQSLMYFKEKCRELETDGVVTDICIVAFGGKGPNGDEPDIQILQPFAPANKMSYDTLTNPLTAEGVTPMAHAVDTCLKGISKITELYHQEQISIAKPQLLIFVKGVPTEDIDYSNNVKGNLKKAVDNRNIWTQNFGIGKWYELGWFRDFFGDENSFALGDINDVKRYIGIFNSLVKYICDQNTADIEGDTDYDTTEDQPSYNFIEPKRLHHPIVILVDKSEAMNGPPINAINQSLMHFKEMCNKKLGHEEDYVIDICIIAFGGKGQNGVEPDIQILQSFTPANKMSYDTLTNPLTAEGVTPMAHALDRCLKEITSITKAYTKNNIGYKRPLLITMVRGKPTDDEKIYDSVHKSIKNLVENQYLWTQSIGLGNVSDFMWLGDFFGMDKSKVLPKIDDIEAYTGFFDTLVNYMSSIEIPISVDIVYCIDATEKRNNPHIENTKNIAKNLHKIITYKINKREYHGQRIVIDALRVKAIVFRDFSSDKGNAIKQTRFFNVLYDTESADYEQYIDDIKSFGGGKEHNSALEAFHLAIKSAWVGENVTDNRRRHIIIMFNETSTHTLDDSRYIQKARDNPLYPTDTPKNMTELFNEWCNMGAFTRRLVIFAPKDNLWREINNNFTPCLFSSVGIDDEFLDQMIKFLIE